MTMNNEKTERTLGKYEDQIHELQLTEDRQKQEIQRLREENAELRQNPPVFTSLSIGEATRIAEPDEVLKLRSKLEDRDGEVRLLKKGNAALRDKIKLLEGKKGE